MSAATARSLLQAAALAARAHRDAVRLLEESIADLGTESIDALGRFFQDPMTYDALLEVHIYHDLCESHIEAMTFAQAVCLGTSPPGGLRKWAAIRDDVVARCEGTCPCRKCKAKMDAAVATAEAAVGRAMGR